MKEVREKHDIPDFMMGRIKVVSFKLPVEYSSWHTRALSQSNMKTAKLVRTVYLNWLKEQAKEQNW